MLTPITGRPAERSRGPRRRWSSAVRNVSTDEHSVMPYPCQRFIDGNSSNSRSSKEAGIGEAP